MEKLTIEITREEYEELINAMEVAMASATEAEKVLLPLRERWFLEYGKPSWWKKDY